MPLRRRTIAPVKHVLVALVVVVARSRRMGAAAPGAGQPLRADRPRRHGRAASTSAGTCPSAHVRGSLRDASTGALELHVGDEALVRLPGWLGARFAVDDAVEQRAAREAERRARDGRRRGHRRAVQDYVDHLAKQVYVAPTNAKLLGHRRRPPDDRRAASRPRARQGGRAARRSAGSCATASATRCACRWCRSSPEGDERRPRPDRHHRARLEQPLHALQRRQARAHVRRRHRPGDLPDAARRLAHRDDAARTPGGSRRTRRGRRARSRSRPARATRSARAGWASTPRASACTARPTRRRSATRPRTAASGCGSRTPSGSSSTCNVGTPVFIVTRS